MGDKLVTNTYLLLNPVLTTATIFLFVILTISQVNIHDIAQAQKTQDQIWQEQHEGIAVSCSLQNPFKEYNEAIGEPTEEIDEKIERCNHDVLYLLGLCEQHDDEYTFCKSVHAYIDDHNLEQIDERPEQLSQETIDKIN